VAVRGNHSRLPGMAGVTLFDGDNGQKTASAGLVAPNAGHIGDAGFLELLPNERGTHEATHIVKFTRGTCRRRAENDGIVAMVQPLYLHGRLGTHVAGVITGPFAEGTFVVIVPGNRFAFNDDLRGGRNRKTGVLALNYLHGMSLQAANPFVFGNTVRHFHAAGKIEQRVVAERNGEFAGLAAGKILFAHDAALFARRNKKAQLIAIMNHDAIRAQIDPALVRVARDVHRAGADVTSAIKFMPLGSGKLVHINVFAFENVFHHRAVFDHFGLEVGEVGDVLLDVFHKLQARVVRVHV